MSSIFDPEVLPPTVGALLRLGWQSFRKKIFERVREAGFDDLQPVEVQLFRYPTIANLRPGQLAEEAGLSKQAVNDLLRQLDRKGYLVLKPDETDGRARLISLTPRGAELMELVRSASQEVMADWNEIIGRKRLNDLRLALIDILEAERAGQTSGPPLSTRA